MILKDSKHIDNLVKHCLLSNNRKRDSIKWYILLNKKQQFADIKLSDKPIQLIDAESIEIDIMEKIKKEAKQLLPIEIKKKNKVLKPIPEERL